MEPSDPKDPPPKPKRRFKIAPFPLGLDDLDDLLTRTYGKHIRKRTPIIYGPEEDR